MNNLTRKGGAVARGLVLCAAILPLLGCATVKMQQVGEGEAPTVLGPPVRSNRTPLEPAFTCMGDQIRARTPSPLVVAVGDIRDYTGKYNINEGNAITQGGSLMVYSALGKLNRAVRIANRYNYDVAQIELNFLNQRVLGTGQPQVLVENGQPREVPWIPYYGGSVIASDYFITGGITELNYNVQSAGAEFRVSQIGPKARVFTLNIGVDLQIVDTKTLIVEDTVSLSKQITGFEVGFDVFRFFDTSLYDINIGNKSEEPLQLGVRSTLEDAVLQLISSVTNVPYQPCMQLVRQWIPEEAADVPYGMAAAPAADPSEMPAVAAASGPTSWERVAAAAAQPVEPDPAADPSVGVAGRKADRPSAAVAEAVPAGTPDPETLPMAESLAGDVSAEAVPTGTRIAADEAAGEVASTSAEDAWPTEASAPDSAPAVAAHADPARAAAAPTAASVSSAAFSPAEEEAQVPEAAAETAVELAIQNGSLGSEEDAYRLSFDYGSTTLSGQALGAIDRIASTARQRAIPVMLVALVNENWAPSKRASLLAGRIESVKKALMMRGVTNVALLWAPDATATGIVLDGAGYQKVAMLVAEA